MNSFDCSTEQPFAVAGGAPASPVNEDLDPFAVLDDLMAVIEALCPVWPEREIFTAMSQSLL